MGGFERPNQLSALAALERHAANAANETRKAAHKTRVGIGAILLPISIQTRQTEALRFSSILSKMTSSAVGWVKSPGGRGTIDILLTNIVALVCVWTVLHHNIQARNESEWRGAFRKLRWSALAVCAPEMLTLFAIMQWNAANRSVAEMRSLSYTQWTRVHGFFANSGDFVLTSSDFSAFL